MTPLEKIQSMKMPFAELKGVIFTDLKTAVEQHADKVQQYLYSVVPAEVPDDTTIAAPGTTPSKSPDPSEGKFSALAAALWTHVRRELPRECVGALGGWVRGEQVQVRALYPLPNVSPQPELREIVPLDGKKGYDVRDVISKIVDWGDYLEVKAGWATNIVTAFARVNGRTVGIVANQPKVMSGCLDINASDKAAEFITFCDSFNIPLVQLVDVPGFLPGVQQEYGGIIRHGAKMLYAYSEATVPKITVVLRKAYGGSYLAMCNRDLGADAVYAWPSAEIAVMGADGAANVIFRRQIKDSEDPAATRAAKIEEYRNAFNTPYVAAARGQVDDVIDPADTRRKITAALETYATKRQSRPAKKHGVMPC